MRSDDLQRTVYIPALAGLVTGAFVASFALALCAWFGKPAAWAAIAGAGAGLLAWLGWSARMAAILEYRLAPGQPRIQATPTQADPQTVNLHIHSEDAGGYIEGAFVDGLPISSAGLATLANLVVSGQSLTTSAMTNSGLDRPTWEALRDRFINAGLLAWRSGNRLHGCEVTGRGLVIFRRLATPPRDTPPLLPHRNGRID